MSAALKAKGPAALERLPSHGSHPNGDQEMNAHHVSTAGAVPATASVSRLIEAHINARAEHDRLFGLNDWGLSTQQAVNEAVDEIDRALVEICRSRPSSPVDVALRRQYLLDRLPSDLDLCPDLLKAVLPVLIDGGDQ